MPDEPFIPDALEQSEYNQREILYLLTDPQDIQPLWTVEDIGREIGSHDDALNAVAELHRSGLIHRTSDGHVFASRATVRFVQMVGPVV